MLRKTTLWPTIIDIPSARLAVRGAVRWSTIWAVVGAAFALIAILGGRAITTPDSSEVLYDSWSFLDSGLFGLVAWKIRNMSKGWAITGLVLAGINLLSSFAGPFFSPLHFFAYLAVLFAFMNGVRGAFAYHRFMATQAALEAGVAPPLNPS